MKLESIATFHPRLQVLNTDQMWAIHEAALQILSTTGFEMKHRGARKMLLDAGCSISRNGRLRMPKRLVETALDTAPKRFMMYDQQGNEAMDLQGENGFYGTGSDTIFTIDVDTGKRRRTVLEDTGNFRTGRNIGILVTIDLLINLRAGECHHEDIERTRRLPRLLTHGQRNLASCLQRRPRSDELVPVGRHRHTGFLERLV